MFDERRLQHHIDWPLLTAVLALACIGLVMIFSATWNPLGGPAHTGAVGGRFWTQAYAFGIGVANERAMRIDLLLRATPLPPAVHLLAKIITALVYSCLSLALLIAFGVLVGGGRQPPEVWLSVALRIR